MTKTKVIGTYTTYVGDDPDEHPYLRGHQLLITGVMKEAADPANPDANEILQTDEDVEAAGGVTAGDRVQVHPVMSLDGRPSFVSSDPRAVDCARWAHLRSR